MRNLSFSGIQQSLIFNVGSISCFLLFLVVAPSLSAQEDTDGSLEEIIVTAQKIEKSLQETPIAISVFTADDLAVRGVNSLDSIANFTPNVEFFASGISGKNSGQAYIRGVGQFDYLLTTDPGVGIYVDGVYLARNLGSILDLVDIERVEILRGPQGTLYGKNTVGGAINVITRRPGDEMEASVELLVGSYDRYNGRASLSGPMIEDVLRGKISFSTKNSDGFGKRPLAGDTAGNEDNYGLQGMLDWTPTDNVNAVFSADYTNVDELLSHHHTEEINMSAPLVGLYNALAGPLAPLHGLDLPIYDTSWLTDDVYIDNSTDSNFNKQEIWGVSATFYWDVAGLSLKSITSYRDMDLSFGTDPDGSPAVIIDEIDVNQQEQLSQEFQAIGKLFDDRLNWVAGLYYLSEDASSEMTIRTYEGIFQALEGLPGPIFPLGPVDCPAPPPAPCAGGPGNPVNIALDIGRFATLDQQTDSVAVYAQGTFDFTDQLSGTYGIRYTDEEKDFTYSSQALLSGFQTVPSTEVNDSWNDVSHRFGLDFQWTDDMMTYLTAAKGFKSGGFNGRGRSINEVTSYDAEELWSYEFGFKSEWMDRKMRLNGALFYTDYTDMQFTLSTSNASGGQIVVVGNAGAAEVKGFELETVMLPSPDFKLTASVGYLDAQYTEIDPATGLNLDLKLIGTPEWSAAVGAEYTLPLQNSSSLAFRADYNYRTKVYFDTVNTESGAQDAYGLLNLRATYTSGNGNWALSGGISNATDKAYKLMGVGVVDSLGFSSSVYGRPREWYLQGSYYF